MPRTLLQYLMKKDVTKAGAMKTPDYSGRQPMPEDLHAELPTLIALFKKRGSLLAV